MELPTINTQPVEPFDYRDDGSLDVVDIFSTIQCEGPYTGRPAVFVRLAGCNLQCSGCDTDYTSNRRRMSEDELDKLVTGMATFSGWRDGAVIVITGGEPLRQNIKSLFTTIDAHGLGGQIETNGIGKPREKYNWLHWVKVVCSPKTPAISPEVERWVTDYKYLLSADSIADDGLPSVCFGGGSKSPPARPPAGFRGRIWVQPVWVGDEAVKAANTQACVDSCLQHGYNLSLQNHKMLGIK